MATPSKRDLQAQIAAVEAARSQLVKALVEMTARLERLEAKLAEAEARLAALERGEPPEPSG